MYFDKFTTIVYEDQQLIDLTSRVVLPDKIKNNVDLFHLYRLSDKDTPESIAFDFYGKASYSWIILLMNDIIDPFHDWLMNSSELLQYVKNNYGSLPEQYNSVHHYEDADGQIYSNSAPDRFPVSNFQYEEALNEKRRFVKLLYPKFIVNMERELEINLKGL